MNITENSVPRFGGVVFDMDGVLCDSEPFICEAAMRMFAQRYGATVRTDDFLPFVGQGENRYIGGVAEKHGIELDIEADKNFTYEIYLEIIRDRLGPLPGVVEFVKSCRKLGMKAAVATSADEMKMVGNLREIGLEQKTFDVCVNGLDVVHKKPDSEIFLLAIERLGLSPEQCLVVEDAPSGIVAGKAAGASCLGLTTSFNDEELHQAGADWTAADLSEEALTDVLVME
ncbi:MAG: HAD-IA family hydrolase [Planctomycetota bacterium]|nr:HAD-IA family hydrolase [Planctomycetota bacterium]